MINIELYFTSVTSLDRYNSSANSCSPSVPISIGRKGKVSSKQGQAAPKLVDEVNGLHLF